MPPFSRILLLTALALLGYALLPRLSVRWQPGPAGGQLRVAFTLPGAGPEVVERQITAPLEGALALVRGLGELRSVSGDGNGYIDVTVDPSADPAFVRFNVAAQLRRLYPSLPPGTRYPTLSYAPANRNEATDRPLLTYVLTGPTDPTTLYRYAADRIGPGLSGLNGLDRVDVSGGNQLAYRIRIDPAALHRVGLDRSDLQQQLRAYFTSEGLGFLQSEDNQFYVSRQPDAPPDRTDWTDIPLRTPGSDQRIVRLGELAEIALAPRPPTGYYRVNGHSGVRLIAYPLRTANTLRLAAAVRERVRTLAGGLPGGYELLLEADATEYLREELDKTRRRSLLSLGILLFFVALAYRNWRRIGILLYALAVNLGLAFLAYWLLSVELNLYAFAGIAVSFGIMIDNLIVVMDALRRGGAINQAVRDVRPPLLGATLTTLAGLSVLLLLPDPIRGQLYELARVMAINLGCSLLVALFFVPALEQRAANVRPAERPLKGIYPRLLILLVRYRKPVLVLTVLAFGLPLWWLPRQIDGADWYNRTVATPYYQDVVRPQMNKWLGGTLRLFVYYVYEGSGFRQPEETRLYVNAALPEGATLNQLDDVLRNVEGYLSGFSGRVARYTTQISSGQRGSIEITFPQGEQFGFPALLKNRLIGYAVNFGGMEWDIFGVGQGYSNASGGSIPNFRVELRGYAQSGLDRITDTLAGRLLRHPRIREVNKEANINWWEKDRRSFYLDYRPEALARHDLTPAHFSTLLADFDRSERPVFYLSDGRAVLMESTDRDRRDRWQLENSSLDLSDSTRRITLAGVAELTSGPAAQQLHKIDQQYLRWLEFDYLGSARFGRNYLEGVIDTLRPELPLGYSVSLLDHRELPEGLRQLAYLGVAVGMIFFICALLFESLRQAAAIVLLIPVSFIGIFLAFYWSEARLDQGGYTSFLLVAGLAVNGLILVVDRFNHLRKQFPHLPDTFHYGRAVRDKSLPIVLTVVSTVAGLLPFLTGGGREIFWYSLAVGTIGGLLCSLVVIALVSPVLLCRRSSSYNPAPASAQ